MDFEDIIKGQSVDANDVALQEGHKALAKAYKYAFESFVNEGFDPQEAHKIAFKMYMHYMTGKAV